MPSSASPLTTRATVQHASRDFWRLEKGKIRESWVLVDLIDMYRQIDVDVFKARNLGAIAWG